MSQLVTTEKEVTKLMSNITINKTNRHEIFKKVNLWLNADNKQRLKDLPDTIMLSMKDKVYHYAKYSFAKQRYEDLKEQAYQSNPETKRLVRTIIVLVGAVTFGAGSGIISQALGKGPITTVGAFAGGALGTYLVDDRANRIFTGLGLKQVTQDAKHQLLEQQQTQITQNQFTLQFYDTQKQLLNKIEGKTLNQPKQADVIIACSLTVVEMAAAFWIVLPGGILVATLAAGLPGVIIWAAAKMQAEQFDIPERLFKLMAIYAQIIKDYD